MLGSIGKKKKKTYRVEIFPGTCCVHQKIAHVVSVGMTWFSQGAQVSVPCALNKQNSARLYLMSKTFLYFDRDSHMNIVVFCHAVRDIW